MSISRRALIGSCFVAIVPGAAALAAPRPQELPDRVAIMSVGVGAMLPTTCIQPAVAAGLWEPEASDVLEADGQLASFLAEQVQGPIPYVLEDFYRQYFGIVVDGRRELYVNGFAARLRRMLREYGEPRVDWRKAPLDICDGGPAHWRAQYDLERGEWTNFETGGFG